jgi:hypothetical protein
MSPARKESEDEALSGRTMIVDLSTVKTPWLILISAGKGKIRGSSAFRSEPEDKRVRKIIKVKIFMTPLPDLPSLGKEHSSSLAG